MKILLVFCCLLWVVIAKELAVIISTANFHYEVAAFVGYHLQHLHFVVHSWLPRASLVVLGGTGHKLVSKYSDKVIILPRGPGEEFGIPKRIKVAIYVTPEETYDLKFMHKLHLHEAVMQVSERVIMIAHSASNVLGHLYGSCRPPKCSVLLLGHHVHSATLGALSHNTHGKRSLLTMSAYSVFDAHLFVPPSSSLASAENRTVTVQGKMKFARRDYTTLYQCFQRLHLQNNKLTLAVMGKTDTDADATSLPDMAKPFAQLKANLAFDAFYEQIIQSEFVAVFANANAFGYLTTRSTSTIPAALSCNTPISMPRQMLRIYHCLRDQKMYQQISLEDDCISLDAALALNKDQLAELREETAFCRKQLMQEASAVFRELTASLPKGGGNSTW